MHDSVNSQAPSPEHAGPGAPPSLELFFRTANAYQESAALRAAVELSLFTAIADGRQQVSEIAEACQASEHGTRILCDYLCVLGFLNKEGPIYKLTADSAFFLSRHSPAYVGGTLDFLNSTHIMRNFADLTSVVRQGGAKQQDRSSMAPEHPMWVTFARAMMPLMAMPSQILAQLVNEDSTQPIKVLDIAAGHGLFGMAFARINPNAQIVAQDWANVLEVAREHAAEAGVADRYTLLPGSAFDVDFGEGYDVVLVPNFLHHFDQATCESLMKKVHAALADGGRAVTLEFVPNEDRVSPPIPATFALMMLGSTPSGDVYTASEYERMFASAGFSRSEICPIAPSPQTAIVSYK